MDRFIDIIKDSWEFGSINLKSNMDRFIVTPLPVRHRQKII